MCDFVKREGRSMHVGRWILAMVVALLSSCVTRIEDHAISYRVRVCCVDDVSMEPVAGVDVYWRNVSVQPKDMDEPVFVGKTDELGCLDERLDLGWGEHQRMPEFLKKAWEGDFVVLLRREGFADREVAVYGDAVGERVVPGYYYDVVIGEQRLVRSVGMAAGEVVIVPPLQGSDVMGL